MPVDRRNILGLAAGRLFGGPVFGSRLLGGGLLAALTGRARAAEIAARTGVPTQSVYSYEGFDAIANEEAIDVVYVVTPNSLHRDLVIRAFEAGKHVMVEKPLADTRERGLEMADLARRQGLVLMADHTYCYTPAVLRIREMIADGVLGDINEEAWKESA